MISSPGDIQRPTMLGPAGISSEGVKSTFCSEGTTDGLCSPDEKDMLNSGAGSSVSLFVRDKTVKTSSSKSREAGGASIAGSGFVLAKEFASKVVGSKGVDTPEIMRSEADTLIRSSVSGFGCWWGNASGCIFVSTLAIAFEGLGAVDGAKAAHGGSRCPGDVCLVG